ncbi:MAG: nickel pincer cofactor biosynthesis protein LarB [Desulfobulbaceae bacterium]|jgi:NCAIR mutase (PurE)-related protein|nr:nickel pincer cofactor biosynthesis protein LarB [Desulfobulbaceae bacterium]
MDKTALESLLQHVKSGTCSVEEASKQLMRLSADPLGYACLDHHRCLRTGRPEVVYGENKSGAQICGIMRSMLERPGVVMATRVDAEKGREVENAIAEVHYFPEARMLVARPPEEGELREEGMVAVVSAGTSDMGVAEEARVTAWCLGNRVDSIYDVGVAGIHRLYACLDRLQEARVLVVVAGMEGALPSVVAGLVAKPIIAVPTSVGYGTGLGGLAALLGLLNSCSPGIAVVNIDNGFGAACVADAINR